MLQGRCLKDVVGSSYYVSPECLKGGYSFPTDLWSAGVIIYIMLSGLPPFNGANTREVFRSIVNQPLNPGLRPLAGPAPRAPCPAPPGQALQAAFPCGSSTLACTTHRASVHTAGASQRLVKPSVSSSIVLSEAMQA